MQGFQNRIANVLLQDDGRHATFVEPITYIAKDGRVFVIPRGATTDGASTPPEIWPFLPPFGSYWLPSALHDCAYQNTLLLVNPQGTGQNKAALTKDDSDLLYKEAMESCGVDANTIEKIYFGVHDFAWRAFNEDRS